MHSTPQHAGAGTHGQGDITLNLDPNILLALEVSALGILVALGIWRIMREPDAKDRKDMPERPYDMRRDGQQLTS